MQKRLLEHFVAGTPARSAAEIIAEHDPLEGEVDENSFGGH